MIRLGDDGTMDTVLVCSKCGEEFRYNFEPSNDPVDDENDDDGPEAYDDFVKWAISDATEEHECPDDPFGARKAIALDLLAQDAERAAELKRNK